MFKHLLGVPKLSQTGFLILRNAITPTLVDGSANCVNQQLRTTFILKRKTSVALHKHGKRPLLRARHFVYDLIEDTNIRKRENVEVILTDYVEGLGYEGDRVAVKPNYAYDKLLLPGLAVYASAENIEKYSNLSKTEEHRKKYSSPYVERTMNILSTLVLAVVMNKEMPWTLERWHIRASFRKAGIHVPETAIELPKNTISGPDLGIESKEFQITVTINQTEKVPVKCRIHHWSTNPGDRLPFVQDHWQQPSEPLFAPPAELGPLS